jgi:epoxyqueuosine reductase
MDPVALARLILDECRALGFHRAGIAAAPAPLHATELRAYLDAGYAGEMTYLNDARDSADVLLEGARSVVVVALSYGDLVPAGVIARYARGDDYHVVMKAKLNALAATVEKTGARTRACVDTAPILERDWAARAGLGFVGKNNMLIVPGAGSWLLLGELVIDVSAEPSVMDDRPRCGECRACLDACPTGAFVGPHRLDARRCISYLTIELTGVIPRDLRPLIGVRIFGCDVCQEVCPFNSAPGADAAPELRDRRGVVDLLALAEIGAAQFRRFVKRTALRRIHRAQLLRNVCVALGNQGDPSAIPVLRRVLARENALVRAHAVWALARLGDDLSSYVDDDPIVQAELA